MARAIKARDPPLFEGKPHEDVVEWLQEYEDTAEFNQWSQAQKFRQVKWALLGFAKNWFRTLDPQPATFHDFSIAITNAFKHPAYESGIAAQLESRRQGMDESPVIYCYEKLNLCHKVDPNMAEGVKLQHLLRGMKPTLVERVYPSINFQAPNTAAFIQQVQLYHQASWIANSNNWSPSDTTDTTPPAIPQFTLRSNPSPGSSGNLNQYVTQEQLEKRLGTMEKELKNEMSTCLDSQKKEMSSLLEKIEKVNQGFLESVRHELRENRSTQKDNRDRPYPTQGRNLRTNDGRIICNNCGAIGHMARDCRRGKKESKNGDGNPSSQNEKDPPKN